jgi:hypothetical protein
MPSTLPLIIFDQACGDAISRVIHVLTSIGLETLRTFDLQAAQHINTFCPCPHHGTGPCDCQMIVLLVYQGSRHPVSLVGHGYNDRTWLYLVDTPQQRADPYLEAKIRQALVCSLPTKLPEKLSHTA